MVASQPLKFHPLCTILPAMTPAANDELEADIVEHGLIDPIITYEGAIIDGRHRYLICRRTGVEPRFEEYTGHDPLAFVISKNLKRRHLSESQRAMIAGRVANLEQGVRSDRAATLPVLPVTQSAAASMLAVSERSVRSAVKIQHEGEPQLILAVEEGRLAVSEAASTRLRRALRALRGPWPRRRRAASAR
jgi:ParB-like chromosome segregation protein Spo0J